MKFVKSHYRGRWSGVVLDHLNRNKFGLSLVLLLKDQNGQPYTRRIIKVISDGWLTETTPIDISNINPDWFKNLPKLPEY